MSPREICLQYDSSIIVRRWLGAWIDLLAIAGLLLAADYFLENELY
jgi:hypothetical protein